MQQRYYDPQIGRFLSTDPAESEFNQYSYASNNPYRFTDPDGRQSNACGVTGCNEGSCNPCSGGGGNDDAEIREQYRHDTGRGAHFANMFAEGSSAAADKADKELTDPKNLLTVIPFEKAIAQLAVVAKVSLVTARPIAQVTKNRQVGNDFRDALAALLRKSGRETQTEVYKWTPFGKRFIDIEVSRNGRILGGVETKVGSSRYTPLQQLKDWWLKTADGYIVTVARDR